MLIRLVAILACVFSFAAITLAQAVQTSHHFVTSNDGTRIALECAGTGPSLLIVHGGAGDRRRWLPMLQLFASHFKACAMDRRGHGESESGNDYTLQKEFEDVAAVVRSLPAPVFVLGHSIGGVCALEAALRTRRIKKLVLYEPPLQDLDHSAVADRMQKMIESGDREQAMITFLREIVMISPQEVDAMKTRPDWPQRVRGVDVQLREIRALRSYRFDPARTRKLRIPTLLLSGSKTASPQLRQAIESLMQTLPHRTRFVFEGEEHNAMDSNPQQFADVVTQFLLPRTKR